MTPQRLATTTSRRITFVTLALVVGTTPINGQGRNGGAQGGLPQLQQEVGSLAARVEASESPTLFTVPYFLIEVHLSSPDTRITASYGRGLAEGGLAANAAVEIYVYDAATGAPLLSAIGATVCAPCTLALGTGGASSSAPRQAVFSLRNAIAAAGGYPGDPDIDIQGFLQVQLQGDAAGVALEGTTHHTTGVTSHLLTFTPLR